MMVLVVVMKCSWRCEKRVEQRFAFGAFECGEFKYTGIHFKQWDDGSIEYDQKAYIEKVEPIQIDKQRRLTPKVDVDEKERKALRSLIGALQYAAVHTRPDISAKVGELQSCVNKAKVEDLILGNRILHEAKTNPVSIMVLPIAPEHVTYCAFSDASFMSGKSEVAHQGTLIFVTTPEMLANKKAVVAPIAWTSKGIPRVVRSTLSAEAAALSNTIDRLLWLRILWAWMCNPECQWSDPEKVLQEQNKAAVVTDCRSMYDILTRTAVPNCSERRTTIECLLIRERLKANCDVRWVTSQAMLADCLTKSMDAAALRLCLKSGRYSLFDEGMVLKQRADGRQRLKWIKENADTPKPETSPEKQSEPINHAKVDELHDFWQTGPENQVRRIHVRPRTHRFVPIGVTGCPVSVGELQACRETRVNGVGVERDFWTGTRGAMPLAQQWTGETVFWKRVQETEKVKGNREGV